MLRDLIDGLLMNLFPKGVIQVARKITYQRFNDQVLYKINFILTKV